MYPRGGRGDRKGLSAMKQYLFISDLTVRGKAMLLTLGVKAAHATVAAAEA